MKRNETHVTTVSECADCLNTTILQIGMRQKFSDYHVELFCVDRVAKIKIERGVVLVTGLPGHEEDVFVACGTLKCATATVQGVDLNALKRRTRQLALQASGGSRRVRSWAMVCAVLGKKTEKVGSGLGKNVLEEARVAEMVTENLLYGQVLQKAREGKGKS